MKFELYESESEQSYTLLEKGRAIGNLLEEDAKVIHEITAANWEDAKAQQERFLYKVTQ